MDKINWVRLLLGGLIAAIICFMTDGFLHERLVSADWLEVYRNLGGPLPKAEHAGQIVYFVIFELGRGFILMYVYVLMRPQCGPGPKTAVCAAVVTWIAFSLTGPAQFIPLGFYSIALWTKVAAFQFVTSILAALAGGVLYKSSARATV